MSQHLILYPTFAMFALTFYVLMRMRARRFAAVRSGQVEGAYYKAYVGEEPEELRVLARHFVNLFEMPTLFYVVCLLIYVTAQANVWLVFWAWTYVVLRCIHSYIHLTTNNILARFGVYFTSSMVLALMWATLLVQLLMSSDPPPLGVVA
ncbi:MAG TPA: MAPEG family protein [Candidatus Limnocylindrales bacterium]|nr:MAPEG family protein [Candidatus Limnocylindrales bacterium]